MTIDELARASALDARHRAAGELDPATMLEQLRRTSRRRSVGSVVALLMVVAVVLVGGALAVRDPGKDAVGPSGASATPTADDPCKDPAITCLGGNRFRVALGVPVTVTLPDNFQGAFVRFGAGTLEDYRNDIDGTGVTVFENATPVTYDASWSRDPSAGTTAASMASWLSKRPFLTHAEVTPTVVGGRSAWRVSAELRPGAGLPVIKDAKPAAPTFLGDSGTAVVDRFLTGEYTLVDVPGAGVTVIWSWTLNHSARELAGNQAYVDGLALG